LCKWADERNPALSASFFTATHTNCKPFECRTCKREIERCADGNGLPHESEAAPNNGADLFEVAECRTQQAGDYSRSTASSALNSASQRDSNMPQYHAYIIGSDGEFQNSVPLEYADDEVALKMAKHLVRGHVELWQYTRKIATFDHQPQRLF
jgi:hypothetical protein